MKAFVVKLVLLVALAGAAALTHGLIAPFRLEPAPAERTVITLPPPPNAPVEGSNAGDRTDGGDTAEAQTPEPATPATGTGTGTGTGTDAAEPRELVLDETEIDLETARLLFDAGAADFIDARIAEEYEAGHILGAMHITPDMIRSGVPAAVDFLSADRPIVVYCGGGDCHDSHLVAERLQSLFGFTRTHVFTGGYPEWTAAGLPVGTGPDPIAELR